ncbi:hypothetical protein ACFYNO_38225 [Kitasatospora sp. NPDC006697]|uniref:hypothetical protein n=1 Tax=Kitasatospora sp. NPDC006697 TaxID=3364020 RepID=UPI00367E787C
MQVELAAVPTPPGLGFAAATPEAVVLLDGRPAAAAPSAECRHGTAWFVRRLGVHLLARLTDRPDRSIAECLADAVAETAALHGGRCDLADPAKAPAAAVLAARLHGASLEYLVLGAGRVLTLELEQDGKSVLLVADEDGAPHPVGASPRAAERARTGFTPLAALRELSVRENGGVLLRAVV